MPRIDILPYSTKRNEDRATSEKGTRCYGIHQDLMDVLHARPQQRGTKMAMRVKED